MTRYDYAIIIVGAGPAGSAAALHLTNLQPRLAERILVLDRATFPRPKLCGGGVTAYADAVLARLGMRLDVPAVIVQQCQCIFLDTSFRLPIGFRYLRYSPDRAPV